MPVIIPLLPISMGTEYKNRRDGEHFNTCNKIRTKYAVKLN